MDTILNTPQILDEVNWVHFRLYKDPTSTMNWISNLDWYHQVLLQVVKPVIKERQEVRAVFFGSYGPEGYSIESNETYERRMANALTNVDTNASYIRLRLSVGPEDKDQVKNELVRIIEANKPSLVWDYETMTTYHVRDDLGKRYGSGNDGQTLQFIRYWDSACRYILSILEMPNNWKEDVDVWGIPHLVNNSLGSLLRFSQRSPSTTCRNCCKLLYLQTSTGEIEISPPQTSLRVPLFLARCPLCDSQRVVSANI